jgi:aminoglycoside/choline kinase family phosphotransferase
MPSDHERATKAVEDVARRHWPGARVRDLVPTAADASARRYLRCFLQASGSGVPESVVVMLNEGTGAAISSEELGVFGAGGPKELPFVNVQRYLARITEAVPRLYGFTAGYAELVLEDVGDVPLWQAAIANREQAESVFARAIDLVADLQSRAVDDGTGCYAFQQAFDRRLFDWELEHFIEYGLRPPGDVALGACREELRTVAERLAALPRVFAHRDYHAWNIHVHEERLRIIDFQDALLAPALYDVASLLTDRITPQLLGDACERRLVARFATQRPAASLGHDAYESFALCALQRVLKVVGRFNYLSEVKGKPRYAEMLPAIMPTARRLCAAVDGLRVTAELLETHGKGGAPCAQ